jgi:hypothetical protein
VKLYRLVMYGISVPVQGKDYTDEETAKNDMVAFNKLSVSNSFPTQARVIAWDSNQHQLNSTELEVKH